MRDIRIKSDACHAPLYHEVKHKVDPFHLLPSSQRLQYFHALSCSSLKISYLIPGLFYCHNTGIQPSPSRLTLDSCDFLWTTQSAASRSRSRVRCYWVATRAVGRLDKEIAGSQAVIKDVVDSGHSENIPTKLRRLARALADLVAYSVHLCHL